MDMANKTFFINIISDLKDESLLDEDKKEEGMGTISPEAPVLEMLICEHVQGRDLAWVS